MTALRKISIDDVALHDRVAETIGALSVETLDILGAWQPLDELSSRTQLEAVDLEPGSIVVGGDRFEATANVYVMLNYGPANDDASFSDEYVANVAGSIVDGIPRIDSLIVDTSSFYD